MFGNLTDPRTGKPAQIGAFRKRVIDETFLGSIPPTITTAGTITHSLMPASVGYVEAATEATVGATASIASSFSFSMTQLEAIEFTVEGLRMTKNQPNATLSFSLRSTGSYGAQVIQSKAMPFAQIQHRGAQVNPAVETIKYDLLATPAQAQKRRSLTWRILPLLKEAHLYEFDTLISSVKLDPSNSSTLTASVNLVTNEAAVNAFQIETFKVYVEHN